MKPTDSNLEVPNRWEFYLYDGGNGTSCTACGEYSFYIYSVGIPPDKFVMYLCIPCASELKRASAEAEIDENLTGTR